MKKAVIFGVTGQDGSYLADLLLEEGYSVVGVARRSSVDTTERLDQNIKNVNFTLIEGDITDGFCVSDIINKYNYLKDNPEEIKKIADAGYELSKKHTYKKRLKEVLDLLKLNT